MKRINLLTGKYSRQAEFYISVKRMTAIAAVIFLLCLLIVSVASLTIWCMQTAVYRNARELADPMADEAARLYKLADEAARRNAVAERFSMGKNADIGLLGVVAAAANGLRVTELSVDSRERVISVYASAPDEQRLTGFTERLAQGGYFRDIILAELERADGRLVFLLELSLGESL